MQVLYLRHRVAGDEQLPKQLPCYTTHEYIRLCCFLRFVILALGLGRDSTGPTFREGSRLPGIAMELRRWDSILGMERIELKGI